MVKDKEKKQNNHKTRKPQDAKEARQEQTGQQSGIWQDQRFQHLVADPRFKQLPKSQRKVKIDKRFQSMFTDKKFNVKYTVDKYGRRVNSSTADDLRKYYELNSSASEDEEDAEAEQQLEEKAISRQTDESDASNAGADTDPGENDALDSDGEEEPKTLRERLLDPDIDYARGHGRLVTDSSSGDESSEEEEDPTLQLDHVWGQLDNEAETTEESTRRLAVCNMDWDRIRATDLMVLFTSFLPPGGSVLSVKIYQSEYGKQRLAEEELRGPQELVGLGKEDVKLANKNAENDSDSEEELVQEQDSDAEEGDDYHMEKLRQYQLNRLRYYYAVVECDSVNTADKIYQECDGNEYESSATRIDLRFIPDDTTFDEDEPTEECTDLPDYNCYQPRQFVNTALQQAKVDLTWDETAVERVELSERLLNGKLEDVSDADIRKIVAYSSEEDEDDEDEEKEQAAEAVDKQQLKDAVSELNPKEEKKPKKKKNDAIAKYKALLAEINEQEEEEKSKKCNFTVTWDIEGKDEDSEENESDDSDVKIKHKPELTPIEKVLQKRSEKNKLRKEMRKKKQKEALGLNANDSNSDSESVPDGVDMNDPYFAEEFANGEFEEPKTKKQQKNNKQKKKFQDSDEEEKQKEQELQLLLSDDDMAEKGKQHFSLSKIIEAENETKSKRKRRKQLKKSKASIAAERKEIEDNFQLNLNDNRFGAVYSSHLFNIDPTDSHFKQTKGMELIINEKLKRRHGDADGETGAEKPAALPQDEAQATKRPKKQLENKLLVKSLKRKIQMQKN